MEVQLVFSRSFSIDTIYTEILEFDSSTGYIKVAVTFNTRMSSSEKISPIYLEVINYGQIFEETLKIYPIVSYQNFFIKDTPSGIIAVEELLKYSE